MSEEGRGYDPDTEERRVRARGKEGVEKFIEDVFFGASEVTLVGLPALWAILETAYIFVEVKFAALFAYATLSMGVAALRGGWVDLGPWPGHAPSMLGLRLVYYNAALLLASHAGARVDLVFHTAVGSLLAAVLVSLAAAAAFPRVAAAARRPV